MLYTEIKRTIKWFEIDGQTQKIPVVEAYLAYCTLAKQLQILATDHNHQMHISRPPNDIERHKIIVGIRSHLENIFGVCQYEFYNEEEQRTQYFQPMISNQYNKFGFPYVPKSEQFLQQYLSI